MGPFTEQGLLSTVNEISGPDPDRSSSRLAFWGQPARQAPQPMHPWLDLEQVMYSSQNPQWRQDFPRTAIWRFAFIPR
jgi:hypothetical protein